LVVDKKKSRTLVLKILATVEKCSFTVELSNTKMHTKLCMIFNVEKCCPKVPHLSLSPPKRLFRPKFT
jgi:hypothetical protein